MDLFVVSIYDILEDVFVFKPFVNQLTFKLFLLCLQEEKAVLAFVGNPQLEVISECTTLQKNLDCINIQQDIF